MAVSCRLLCLRRVLLPLLLRLLALLELLLLPLGLRRVLLGCVLRFQLAAQLVHPVQSVRLLLLLLCLLGFRRPLELGRLRQPVCLLVPIVPVRLLALLLQQLLLLRPR
jgi:hypothetical protein